jgi:hypothetical protein
VPRNFISLGSWVSRGPRAGQVGADAVWIGRRRSYPPVRLESHARPTGHGMRQKMKEGEKVVQRGDGNVDLVPLHPRVPGQVPDADGYVVSQLRMRTSAIGTRSVNSRAPVILPTLRPTPTLTHLSRRSRIKPKPPASFTSRTAGVISGRVLDELGWSAGKAHRAGLLEALRSHMGSLAARRAH